MIKSTKDAPKNYYLNIYLYSWLDNYISCILHTWLHKIYVEAANKLLMLAVLRCSGYMAPEYVVTGHYSVRSDVYSFGVIVLEIISGQQSRFGGLQLDEAMLHRVSNCECFLYYWQAVPVVIFRQKDLSSN